MTAKLRTQSLWRTLRDDPRAALGKAQRALHVARAKVLFRSCQVGRGVAASGRVQLEGAARVTLGSRVTFLGGMIPTRLVCGPQGSIEIGDDTVLNYGALLSAVRQVRIGRRCMLASMVQLDDRGQAGDKPIVVGDDVWIAHGAIVEPGVTIGDGSVVAAGAVVTKDVPPRTMAIGNPARVVALELVARE